ncbi:MAG: hypothetical protein ABIZ70_09230 [Gemmatimonadales bacterium]
MKVRLARIIVLSVLIAPAVSAQIVQTEQSSGTKALLIAVSPVNERVVWASGTGGTWVRTVDGGATWQTGVVPGADSLQFRDVHAVDADHAWLLSIGPGSASRIYITRDAGAHWTEQYRTPEPTGFFDCMDFWNAKRGLAIGDEIGGRIQLLRTEDGGDHWNLVPAAALPAAQPKEGSFAASGLCLIARSGGRAWFVASASPTGRVFRTADFGKHWSVDTLPITTTDVVGPNSIAFRDARHGMVFGGGPDGAVQSAVTEDGGAHWTPRGRPGVDVFGGVYVPGTRTATVVVVGRKGAAWSRDEGMTWTTLNDFNYWSVGFASPNAGWAVGVGGRISKLSGF